MKKWIEFVRFYVFEWHVFSAVAIPVLFGLLFPVYWFIICPQIWQEHPDLYQPRFWLVAYWLFASILWFLFLAICFYHLRNEKANKLVVCKTKHESTEDLWSEDQYLPDSYLPSPDYLVSVNNVQPEQELKQEVDETWDYNYEETRPIALRGKSVPFERHYHSLGILRDEKRTPRGSEWRKYSEPIDVYNYKSDYSSNTSTLEGNTDEESSVSDCRKWINRRCYSHSGSNRRRPAPNSKTQARPSSVHYPSHVRPIRPLHYPVMRRPSSSSFVGSSRHLRPIRFEERRNLSSTSSTEIDNPSSPNLPRRKTHPQRHIPPPATRKNNLITRPLPPHQKFHSVSDNKSYSSGHHRDDVTEAEMRSLREVCKGRIERKDSLVTDSKFDDILASLQSLAEDLEKDFQSSFTEDEDQPLDSRPNHSEETPPISSSSQMNSM